MRRASAYLVALLALTTAGCVLSGKNAKPAVVTPAAAKPAATAPAPSLPKPLSLPQTQVELPPAQPVDPAALSAGPPPEQEVREAPPVPRPPAARPRPSAGPRPETAAPAAAPPAADPAPPQIQEIVPAAEARRFQDSAQSRRRDVQQILDQLGRRRLSPAERNVITNINSFLTSSLDAERRGDMKLADALADRAQILARDLSTAK